MQVRYRISVGDTVLQKTPTTFDVSVWELFWPTVAGARTVLAEPGLHREPSALAELIDAERISVIHFVPAMLDVFLACGTRARLDSLRLVFTSGAALGSASAAAVLSRTGARLHNLYGPTEAAVDVTAAHVTPGSLDGRPVSIGNPTEGNTVHVLDRRLRPVPIGVTGELYLGGVQLARGYHGRPALTAGRFVASPFGPGERLYRTGDLVRWRRTGAAAGAAGVERRGGVGRQNVELEFCGRSDFQIKLRGQRVEPGEIEAALAAHPDVSAVVVVPYDDPRSGPQLVAHVVPAAGSAADARTLRAHLADRVPEHMVPAHILTTDALPLSASGKVDTAALPWPATPVRGDHAVREPATATETAMLGIFRELLGDGVGVDDDFFEHGGNSLTATRVVAAVGERLGARLAVREVFDHRTAAALAALADQRDASQATAEAEPGEPGDPMPLAAAQRQMWLHNRIDPASSAYLILAPLRIPGRIDVPALTAAIADVLDRHEVLRTVYPESVDGPRPQVLAPGEYSSEALVTVLGPGTDADSAGEPAVTAALAAAMDLTVDLPLRVVVRPDGDHTVVVLAVHHVVADGWSMRILAADTSTAYRARVLGGAPDFDVPSVSYADHLRHRAARRGSVDDPSSSAAAHLRYWRDRLADVEDAARPRPDGAPEEVARVHRAAVDSAAGEALAALAERSGATLFSVLHAALAVALARSAGGTDVIIGTPLSGREAPGVAETVGMFVTTVPLRTTVEPESSVRDIIEQSQQTVLGALDHGDLDIEEIVDLLDLPRHRDSHPLIHATLTVDGTHPAARGEGAALATNMLHVDVPVARFDIEFTATPDASGGLQLAVVHRGEAYRARTAATLLNRWERVILAMAGERVEATEGAQGDIDLTTPAERAALTEITRGGPAPADRYLGDVLTTPGQRMITVDADGRLRQHEPEEIAAHTNRLARLLIARGAGPETAVALCLSRSYLSVIATRAVAATGAAFVPVDPRHPADRVAFMLEDSTAALIVTTVADRDLTAAGVAALGGALVLDDPAIEAELARYDVSPLGRHELRAAPHPDQTAYLIYTSGTSGRPKAVAVTHRGIASFVAEQRRYGVEKHSRVLHFASPSFDASVLELLLAADAGATAVVVPRSVYGADDLSSILREAAVTHAFLTPAVLDTIDEELPELTTVIVGGDACSTATADRWIGRGTRFFNAYGPTETTVMATLAGPIRATRDGLPIGEAITGSTVRVLGADLRPVLPGAAGEAYVSGPGLARGYHGRPGLTAVTFVADPDGPPGSRRYRTGDLVAAASVGEEQWQLRHLGRLDAQLKIRGHRVELGEVESALHGCPEVRAAVAAGRPGPDGRTTLVAYVVPADGADVADALRDRLRATLPSYAVPTAFVELAELPLTPSGKVDHRRLPEPEFASTGPVAVAGTSEVMVAEAFAQALGRTELGRDGHFFDLGGNSLMAAQTVALLRARTGRELAVADLFDAPTVAGLAARLDAGSPVSGPGPGDLERPEHIPLAPAQQGMWFLNRFDPDARTENIPLVLRMTGDLNVPAFLGAVDALVRRHEVLRTAYPDSPDGPRQLIRPGHDHGLEVELRAVPETGIDEAVRSVTGRGFDVTARPPVRAALLSAEEGTGRHTFVLVLHHISADGLSVATLAGELAAEYRTRLTGDSDTGQDNAVDCTTGCAPTPLQFADFAVWQHSWLNEPDGTAAAALASWHERLRGAPPVIDLPTDRPRPVRPSGRGARVEFAVEPALHARMVDFAARNRATVFMVAHTALAVLLGRLGNNRDVVIGTPSAGRVHARLQGAVGMFVNMLALRTDIHGAATGAAALAISREAALHAFANAGVPFDTVVAGLDLTRSVAHHPVFQVALSYQNIGGLSMELPGLDVTVVDDSPDVAEFDLHLTLAERGEPGLTGQLVFATDLFDEATAAEFAARYVRILAGLLDDPDLPVGDLPVLGDDEPHAGSAAPPDHPCPGSQTRGLVDGFVRCAEQHPDAVAVVDGTEQVTYGELSERVGLLAAALRDHGIGSGVGGGVGSEERVAITAPRGLHQLVAMYAVVACGAAYVPVDPSAPQRASMILEVADPALVLGVGPSPAGDRAYLDLADLAGVADLADVACGDAASEWRAADRPDRAPHPESAAYVLFTSGSSGTPKGVSVPHAAVSTQLAWMQERYRLGRGDTVLLRTAAGFDLSVWEYWWALQAGARIVIAEPGSERDGTALRRQIAQHRVSVLPTVPSSLSMILDAGELPGSVRTVLCIGEELPPELVARLRASGSTADVHNLYGPTEFAVSATGHEVAPGTENECVRIPIGVEQPTVRARVLDARLHPVPVGVVGELYLAGPQLARGYHADPARTAASFVADPAGGGRMYRTGDLVRRTRGGLLEYVGRADFQLQIRGFRVEPGEIEAVLRRCPGVGDAAVTAVDGPGGARLVAFVTGDADTEELTGALADRLPAYLRPDVHRIEALPYNANGKVDRARLPRPERRRRDHRPAESEVERAVAEVVSEVTGAPVVGMSDDFFELGGNSLTATRVAARLAALSGRSVPVRTVFDAADLGDLAARIERAAPTETPELVRIDDDGPIPLAPAQRRIWEAVRAGQGADWNVPIALRFTGELDRTALHAALRDVFDTHEALRTRYRSAESGEDGGLLPVGEVLGMPEVDAALRDGLVPVEVDAGRLADAVSAAAWEPLHLDRIPLRARLFTSADDSGNNTAVLLLVLHHLNFDGRSMPLLARDVLTAFTARATGIVPESASPPVRYRDYARWRSGIVGAPDARTEHFRRSLDYWTSRFGENALPGPQLLTDRPRPQVWDSRGDSVGISVEPELHRELDRLARSRGGRLFPVLQAAFALVLSTRIDSSAGADRAVHLATANANRVHAAVDGVIGNFADDVPMRIDASDDHRVADMIADVHGQLVDGFAHADVTVPDLLDHLGVTRGPGGATGHPVFPATLILQQAEVSDTALTELDLGTVTVAQEPIAAVVAKHELEVTLLELREDGRPAGLRGTLLYPVALLDAATAAAVVDDLLSVLRSMAAADDGLTAGRIRAQIASSNRKETS